VNNNERQFVPNVGMKTMAANQVTFMSVYQRQKLSLDEITDKIADVAEIDVSLAEERYSAAQEFLTMVKAASIPEGNERFTITCAKSGAFIRNVTLEEFAILEKIHGSNHAIELLELRCNTHISGHWLQTDGATLEKLSEHDPFGYFIYAADKVLRATQDIFINYHQIKDTPQQMALEYKWHRKKHIAWKAIQKQPIAKVIKANELMRRYLSIVDTAYARHIVKFETNNIIDIAEFQLPNFINDLQSNLRAILQWAWKNNRIRRDLTIDDIIKLKNIFKGHSNFAQQRRVANQPILERILDELQPLFEQQIPGRYRMPIMTEEKLKELQTGKVKAFTLTQKTFSLKVQK
jgi:hypothetical protein